MKVRSTASRNELYASRHGFSTSAASFQCMARSTALFQPLYRFSRSSGPVVGVKVSDPEVLTLDSVSGFDRSQPNSPSAAPASSADPRAVDLQGGRCKDQLTAPRQAKLCAAESHALSHLWPHNVFANNVALYASGTVITKVHASVRNKATRMRALWYLPGAACTRPSWSCPRRQ